MSTINTIAATPDGTAIPVVDANQTGFSGINSETFIKLLVTQLQNQDPSEPVSNEQLLTQISQMRALQSSTELSDTLKELTTSQKSTSFTSAAASFIGKEITGISETGEQVSGKVDRAVFRGGKAFIGIGATEIPIDGVTTIREADDSE